MLSNVLTSVIPHKGTLLPTLAQDQLNFGSSNKEPTVGCLDCEARRLPDAHLGLVRRGQVGATHSRVRSRGMLCWGETKVWGAEVGGNNYSVEPRTLELKIFTHRQ